MEIGDTIDWDDMQDHLYEALGETKTEYLTEIYNNICPYIVKYVGDDKWEIIGEN